MLTYSKGVEFDVLIWELRHKLPLHVMVLVQNTVLYSPVDGNSDHRSSCGVA